MIGGLENYVYHLGEQQIRNGHQVAVLTLNKSFVTNKELEEFEKLENGIELYRIPFFFLKKYAIALKSYSYLTNYDIVHVHAVDFFSDYISLSKRFHKKRTILTTHGGFFHTSWAYILKKVFFNIITRLTIKSYDAVIGCSDNDIEIFRKIAPGIIKIENGVNVKPLLNAPKKPDGHTLVYVGRIDIHKRIDNLIRLIAILNNQGFKAKLMVVGPDWKHLLPELIRLANDLEIKDQVTFTGPVDEKDLVRYYSKAFLFVSASEYEGFGISAIEALASGTPCVLNDIRSFQTILKNKPFGILCNFSNIEETANAIIEFANTTKDNYWALSKEARETAKKYNWESVARKMTKIYELNQ
jgi:alpha-1,3-mannosyltransferase